MKTKNKKDGEYTSISKNNISKSKSKSFKDELNSEQLDFINKLGHHVEIKNKKIILSILELKKNR